MCVLSSVVVVLRRKVVMRRIVVVVLWDVEEVAYAGGALDLRHIPKCVVEISLSGVAVGGLGGSAGGGGEGSEGFGRVRVRVPDEAIDREDVALIEWQLDVVHYIDVVVDGEEEGPHSHLVMFHLLKHVGQILVGFHSH